MVSVNMESLLFESLNGESFPATIRYMFVTFTKTKWYEVIILVAVFA